MTQHAAPHTLDGIVEHVAERLHTESTDEARDITERVVSLLASQIVRGFADDEASQHALDRLADQLPGPLGDVVRRAESAPWPLAIANAHSRLAGVWGVSLDVARARCNTVVELLAQSLDAADWQQLHDQLHAPWRDYLERLRMPLGTRHIAPLASSMPAGRP